MKNNNYKELANNMTQNFVKIVNHKNKTIKIKYKFTFKIYSRI